MAVFDIDVLAELPMPMACTCVPSRALSSIFMNFEKVLHGKSDSSLQHACLSTELYHYPIIIYFPSHVSHFQPAVPRCLVSQHTTRWQSYRTIREEPAKHWKSACVSGLEVRYRRSPTSCKKRSLPWLLTLTTSSFAFQAPTALM